MRVFKLHFIYSVIEGLILGAFLLNEFIFLKSLKGSNFQLGLLFQFSAVVFLVSAVFNEIIKRCNKRFLLRIVALGTRLPLVLFFFFPTDPEVLTGGTFYHLAFLFIFLFFFLSKPLTYPSINYYLKNNYQPQHFGRLFGYATTSRKVVMFASTFLFGILLDFDPYAFVYIYPLLGILGLVSIYLLTMIDHGNNGRKVIDKPLWSSVGESIKRMYGIIKSNKPYRDFEIGFMLYGLAFMMNKAVAAIFLTQELNLSYTSIAFYQNIYNIMGIIIIPIFGRLLDKLDPRRFGTFTFSALLLYTLLVMLTEYLPFSSQLFGIDLYYVLLGGYLFYGMFSGMVILLWNVGSSYFCEKEVAHDYQSVHLTLVGVRATYSPLIGVWLYELLGFTGVFSLAVFSLILAIGVLQYSLRQRKLIGAAAAA